MEILPHGVDSALVAAVESRGRIGRVGDVRVNGMGHLVTDDGELVHLHPGLVLAVDALVSEEASGGDLFRFRKQLKLPLKFEWTVAYHVGGHAITNEEDDILSLTLLGKVTDKPLGSCLLSVIVVERDCVLARLVESKLAVGLGGNIDDRRCLSILGEEILVPGKVPGLKLRLLDAKDLGKVASLLTLLGDCDCEFFVGLAVVSGLGAVDGGVDFDPEVEELAGKEIALVRGQKTTKVGTGSQTLVGLRGDLGDGRQRGRDEGGIDLRKHCGVLLLLELFP